MRKEYRLIPLRRIVSNKWASDFRVQQHEKQMMVRAVTHQNTESQVIRAGKLLIRRPLSYIAFGE